MWKEKRILSKEKECEEKRRKKEKSVEVGLCNWIKVRKKQTAGRVEKKRRWRSV